MYKRMLFLILIACAAGCAVNTLGNSQSLSEIRRLPLKKYSFDFSKTTDKGELVIVSQPPSMQLIIDNYHFSVAGQKIEVFKNSVSNVVLDKGDYVIQGGANMFGLPTSKKVMVQPAEKVCLIFHGPVDMFTTGSFWQVQCTDELVNSSFAGSGQ